MSLKTQPPNTDTQRLRAYRDWIDAIVAARERSLAPFYRDELPREHGGPGWPLTKLRDIGAVRIAEDHGEEPNEWQLTSAALQVADSEDDRFAPCPCGHAGLRNLNGREFACAFERCDRRFERDELEVDG